MHTSSNRTLGSTNLKQIVISIAMNKYFNKYSLRPEKTVVVEFKFCPKITVFEDGQSSCRVVLARSKK